MPWVDTFDLGDALMEIGPGPGRTTDQLRERVVRLTAVEVDHDLAAALAARLGGTNVSVLERSAADTGLEHRLTRAGFADVSIDASGRQMRFSATTPTA